MNNKVDDIIHLKKLLRDISGRYSECLEVNKNLQDENISLKAEVFRYQALTRAKPICEICGKEVVGQSQSKQSKKTFIFGHPQCVREYRG